MSEMLLRECLEICRQRFAEYAAMHAEKGTASGEVKALRNLDMVDLINAALDEAALATPVAAMGGAWKSMDTAPKDGTDVILFGPNVGVFAGNWEDKFGFGEVTGWRGHDDNGVFSDGAVTLWQPMPASPTAPTAARPADPHCTQDPNTCKMPLCEWTKCITRPDPCDGVVEDDKISFLGLAAQIDLQYGTSSADGTALCAANYLRLAYAEITRLRAALNPRRAGGEHG